MFKQKLESLCGLVDHDESGRNLGGHVGAYCVDGMVILGRLGLCHVYSVSSVSEEAGAVTIGDRGKCLLTSDACSKPSTRWPQ